VKKSFRPKLPIVSEQMKAWSAALASEIGEWPEIATRSFFGFTALYRKDRIFALLPRTRGMKTSNSMAFKFDTPAQRVRRLLEQDSRVGSTQMQNAHWFTFELSSDSDLHDALNWLGLAYAAAGKSKRSS
jgi:hypothetical protein